MIEIDGSLGEGGGQIVRSSLALSAMTGVPLKLLNIRGGRKKPGLLRQHLTGLRAITQICGADVSGDQLGSHSIEFTPGEVKGGEYAFAVGSAGSAILVAQTILPALMRAGKTSKVTIDGGTHAAWAPPFDFFERCYLPLLSKMNASVSASIQSHGFYPAGGGRMEMIVEPVTRLRGLELMERRGPLQPRVIALVAQLPVSIAQRECDVISRRADWSSDACHAFEVPKSGGPGNVVMIECGFDNLTELFIGFGKVGVKAEQIARQTLREARKYLASKAPVGEYLADQLLLPMGIAAAQGRTSRFGTGPLSQHSHTHIEILKRFLDIEVTIQERDHWVAVTVEPPKA